MSGGAIRWLPCWHTSTAVSSGFIRSHGGSSERWRRRPNTLATRQPFARQAHGKPTRRPFSTWRSSSAAADVGWPGEASAWTVVVFWAGGIDHILNAPPSVTASPRRKAATAVCCMAATFVVVSCRPRAANVQTGPADALEPSERKLRADLERASRTQFPVGDVDGSPDPAQVVALEAAAARNPDDLTVLKSLLVAYWIQPPADLAKRRARIVWLIEHHPDVPLAGSIEARLFRTTSAGVPWRP